MENKKFTHNWKQYFHPQKSTCQIITCLKNVIVHGEKNLGLNTRELMNFTRGLLIVQMAQASLARFAITSCVQCTIRSLVLKAPTHLRKSLESVEFIATPRRAKPVKLSTGYFQEIPRDFFVRLLGLSCKPRLLQCSGAALLNHRGVA